MKMSTRMILVEGMASDALENAAKYLDKLSNLGKNLSLKTAANLLSHIESSIQNAQKSANNYNLNSATLKDARAIREQINASANELQNALNLLKNKDSNFKAFLTRYDPNNKENATLKEALSKQNEPKANHIRINIQTSNTGSTAHSSSLNANPAQALQPQSATNLHRLRKSHSTARRYFARKC